MPTHPVPYVTPSLARSARDHFQRFYAEPQTLEDGREMATNVLGFFRVLDRLRRERVAAGGSLPNPPPIPPFKPKRRSRQTRPE